MMGEQANQYHHGDLRAALIIEAAAMIAEGGVVHVTMRAISQRLGVSRAAPYRHFANKSSLLVAVAANGFERLEARLQSLESGTKQATIQRFRRMGEEYVRFAIENPAHYRLMYGKEAITRRIVPELRSAGDALLHLLVSEIKTLQRAGHIKRKDPEALAYVAWGAVHGLASLVIEGQIQPKTGVEDLIEQTTRSLLDGMRTRQRS